MRNKVTNVINVLVLLILTVGTFWVIFSNNDIEEILELIGNGDARKLILGLLLALLSVACEATIIYLLFTFLKEKVRYLRCLKYSFIGFYYCGITPSATGGQPAQVYYMTRDGSKLSSASLIILVIIITYKLALLGLIGVLAIFNGSYMLKGIENGVSYFFIFGLLVNIACIALYILVFFSSDLLKKMIVKVIYFLSKIKIIRKPEKKVDKVVNSIDEYKEGTTFIKNNLKIFLPIMIITFIQRLSLFSITYVVCWFFGGTDISYINFLTLQIIVNTSVDSLPLPGGMGANEYVSKKIYGMAFAKNLIVPSVLLTRGISFYCMMVISAIVSLVAHLRMTIRRSKRVDNI